MFFIEHDHGYFEPETAVDYIIGQKQQRKNDRHPAWVWLHLVRVSATKQVYGHQAFV